MFARRSEIGMMSISSTIGHEKSNGVCSRVNCAELDDLLREILGDQTFGNFHSQQQDGKALAQESTTPLQTSNQVDNVLRCNVGTAQTFVPTSWEPSGGTVEKTSTGDQVNFMMTQQASSPENNSKSYPLSDNDPENQASSPAVCFTGVDYNPVPYDDPYGRRCSSSSYYDQSGRFVHGLCSEEPVAWLDRQRMKLQMRNENRRWFDQSVQQKQLIEELKEVQLMVAQKRYERAQRDGLSEQYADSFHENLSQTQRYGVESATQMNGQLRGLDAVYDDVLRRNYEAHGNEENYFVSGVEVPPFSVHRTKYVFSVSSQHPDPINGSHGVQLNQKVSGNPGPPTPMRLSSRDAMRRTVTRDWELEQREQRESYAIRSVASERLPVYAMDNMNGAEIWNCRLHGQYNFNSSSGCLDRSMVFDASNASQSSFSAINGPILNCNGIPMTTDGTLISTNVDSFAENGTCMHTDGNFDTLQNSSSTSGTSSLSINSTTQSAFEPVPQYQVYGDANASYEGRIAPSEASTLPPSNPERELFPVSASIVVTSHKSSAMHQSFSDSALGDRSGFSRRSQNPNEDAPVHTPPNQAVYAMSHTLPSSSSSLPSDVPFLSTSFPSWSQPPSSHVSSSVASLEQNLVSKKSGDDQYCHAASGTVAVPQTVLGSGTGTRQLAAIAEQPSGNDETELISLQLIGPGMQKLEPDGDPTEVQTFAPKSPQSEIDVHASNFSKTKSLDTLGDPSGENLLPPATHQKFNIGSRSAAMTACNHRSITGDFGGDRDDCNDELRTRTDSILNGDQMMPGMKHRRHTTMTLLEPLKINDANRFARSSVDHLSPDTAPASAYCRTERLLSADFTVQGFGRRGSLSPGDQPRRNSKLVGENGDGESPSKAEDGSDDAFAGKTDSETSAGDRRRQSKAQREKEVNLAMLDSAVAGLQASASSPEDESSPNSVVQSPQSGKTTPGFYAGHDTLSPRTSIHPLSNGAVASSTNNADVANKTFHAPHFVRDLSKYWHRPNISRDEAIASLKNKPAGAFVIRNSNSFPGAFGLALKLAQLPPNVQSKGGDPKAELVRHFLIEPTSKGVKLKGSSSEPVFGSLAALVYQHSLTPLSLPCRLILPDPSNLKNDDGANIDSDVTTSEELSQGVAYNALYINSVDMESLTGSDAIAKAVAATLAMTLTPLTTIVHFNVSSQGVTLTDTSRRLFFRRHYPVDTVTFAGIDPELRNWTWTNEETKSVLNSKIFGFVARKQGSSMENACHVFAELDSDQSSRTLLEYIMKVMLGQGRSKRESIYC